MSYTWPKTRGIRSNAETIQSDDQTQDHQAERKQQMGGHRQHGGLFTPPSAALLQYISHVTLVFWQHEKRSCAAESLLERQRAFSPGSCFIRPYLRALCVSFI